MRRKKVILSTLGEHLTEAFRELLRHKNAEVVERHLMPNHKPMCVTIPPRIAMSKIISDAVG